MNTSMNNHNRTIVVTLMLLFALLLAACGGKSKAVNPEVNAQPAAQSDGVNAVQGDATVGAKSYQASCVACHGPDAKGVQGLGKSLHPADSEFIRAQSDDELVQFIKVGRQPDNPANTTGIAMPPKGGNPAISDADLYHIVAWIRSLEQE
jgi:cytochrome c5